MSDPNAKPRTFEYMLSDLCRQFGFEVYSINHNFMRDTTKIVLCRIGTMPREPHELHRRSGSIAPRSPITGSTPPPPKK